MKVIVTGGAGFIGSHLCERLLEEKHTVYCIDNFLTGSRDNIIHLLDKSSFKLIIHDIVNPLPKNLTAEAIFHLASPASPNHHSKLSYHMLPMETMLANTSGTLELLKFSRVNKAKFLFASSSEIYGDALVHPQKESYNGNTSSTGPRSIYDEAKRFGETLTMFFFRQYSLDTRIARIFNTYGPRMLKSDMRMVIRFINEAMENKEITIFGDGTQTRSLCFVDDMIEGLMHLMFFSNTKGEIVNLGSTEEHSVLDYAKLVKKLTNSKSNIVLSEKLPIDDPKKRCPDISKAKKLLNWMPKISIEKGLEKMINYYQKL